jgi:hypothetical protein
MLRGILFTSLLLGAAPALAQTVPVTGQPNAAQPKKERIICESETQIGSRLATKRVCMTESQWKDHQQQVQNQLDQTHVNVQSKGGPG